MEPILSPAAPDSAPDSGPDSAAEALIADLVAALPPGRLKVGAEIAEAHMGDWSTEVGGAPLALALPQSTAEVAAVLSICNVRGRAVVPQGGLTGLAGGAVPSEGCVLLSLKAMNTIGAVDPASATMVVEAGAILQTVQEAAEAAGMMFPLDLGARGSCQIGGNLSTNAGGNRVIRYGMARDLVLGLEAVMADGTVLSMMNEMPKNNAALDLKHLFIGSEGTLGVITRAVLRLQPGVSGANTALVALPDFAAALNLLRHAQREVPGLSAFELMWNDYYSAATAPGRGRAPLPRDYPLYALLDAQSAVPEREAEAFQAMLEEALEREWVLDASIAQSHRDAQDFWSLRDAIAEMLSDYAPTINFDVSVPVTHIGVCVDRMRAELAAAYPGLRCLFFGHVGDSNIHLVAGPHDELDPDGRGIEAVVYGIVRDHHGSVSAEHGIGTHKLPWLPFSRTEAELSLLRTLKAAMDPKGILNPGKVLAL